MIQLRRTTERYIFCKNLPFLRREHFDMTFFGIFPTIIDGVDIFVSAPQVELAPAARALP